ncbi:MAG: alpha/beta hydrolase [Betaproteobacteria bacterium]|nr:alpha/beta hydrolase [Betaproteobacteria bacterium]
MPGTANSGTAAIDQVTERIRKLYGGWDRTTTIDRMRGDWDELLWSDSVAAQSEKVSAQGVDATWIVAAEARPDTVLLYLHGGGFQVGSVRSHRDLIARLSRAAGCRALAIDYRRAPEHRFPAALSDAIAAYQWLLEQGVAPARTAIAGDSAGGGLALSTLLVSRERNLPLPAAAVVLSAWTDLAATGESYVSRAAADPLNQRRLVQAMARNYLGDCADPRDPLASPLFADLAGLPPLLMQVGDRETVLDDSRNFAAKARAAGVQVELEVWDKMIHVFQQFAAELPQAGLAIDSIGRFLRRHWQL